MANSIFDIKDNYEWEAHIFFDDAFENGPDGLGNPREVNQFVKQLIKLVAFSDPSVFPLMGDSRSET